MKAKNFLYSLCLTLFVPTTYLLAANITTNVALENPLGKNNNTLSGFIAKILSDIVVPVGAIILVIALIYVGFLFVTAQGNDEKLKGAKNALFYTVIGGAVLLGASVLADLITATIKQLK